jgi:threonine dehydratase
MPNPPIPQSANLPIPQSANLPISQSLTLQPPTLQDIYRARAALNGVISRTPLMRHSLLTAETGIDILVKHENHNPTGAFKIRGGLNLIAALDAAEREKGVITASTGNHGQSIAFAALRSSVPCIVAVPENNNAEKNAAMRAFGATVVEHGRDFDEAREWVEREAVDRRPRYVHSANEPLLIAGVGTYALEIFEDAPDVDVVIVPIGGGSGASGSCIVRTHIGSTARIIGVQAAEADAFTQSWKGPARITRDRIGTFAEGLATRVTFDLTFEILKRELDDIVTLTEAELEEGVRLALRTTHNLAEGAGAASLMAALKMRDQLRGKKVVCVMTGGNMNTAMLKKILNQP